MLRQQEWRYDVDADSLLQLDLRDFGKRFNDRNTGIIDQKIDRS